MLVALIATASLSYLQFDSGDILLIAATIATVGALWTFYISSLSSYPVSSTTKPIINASTYVLVGCFILRNAIHTSGVDGKFTSDGDSATKIGFERSQQTHSTVCVENLRDTRHLSELHRKHVKNVDFNKQMFPGINENEQGRIRARF
jgi:hypothetical protein